MSRRILVDQLSEARDAFCGLGTRAVKLKLNKLAKTDALAKAFRIALEIEDCSTQAKKYFGEWKGHYFEKKVFHIQELIRIFEQQKWVYGMQETNDFPPVIIYFEIPGCEQISFHSGTIPGIPDYAGEWDQKRNSTLGKLETAIKDYLAMDWDFIGRNGK